jgi:hypothetical protein
MSLDKLVNGKTSSLSPHLFAAQSETRTTDLGQLDFSQILALIQEALLLWSHDPYAQLIMNHMIHHF